MKTAEAIRTIEDSFTRTVDAVSDLGWDSSGGEPIDSSLDDNMRKGTVIEVPEGEYLVTEEHAESDLKNWGLRATGDVTFVAPKGEVLRVFNLRGDCDNILIEGITFDQRAEYRGSLGNVVQVKNGVLVVKDVEMAGWEPSEGNGSTSDLNVWPLDSGGTIIIDGFVRKGRTELVDYPANSLCLFSGHASEGTIYVRNSHFENCGEHGIYASRVQGNVRIENTYFKNNQNTHARISGAGSYVKNSTFVWDTENHPNKGNFQAMTGMVFEGGHTGQSGGLAEGCKFIDKTPSKASGMLKVDGSHGGMTIRDCQLVVFDGANVPPVNIEKPGSSHMLDGEPQKPWDVTMKNVHVTHRGGSRWVHDYAVRIQGRPGSVFEDVCIDSSESSGINALQVEDGSLQIAGNSTINGDIVTEGASVDGDYSDLGSCSIPDDSGGPDTEPVEPPLPREIVVRAPEGADAFTYEFTTDGEIELVTSGEYAAVPRPPGGKGEIVTENGDGTYTAEGIVANGGGDTFRFEGDVLRFTAEGAAILFIDGKEVDPAVFETRILFVDISDVPGSTEYAIEIDGKASTEYSSSTIYEYDGKSFCVGYSYRWNHSYEINGTVEKVYAPSGARITVDGEQLSENDVEWYT